MALKLDLIGITVADMAESLRFYRLLDIEVPDATPGEDHLEAVLPNGLRIAWDTLELMKQIDPDWEEPRGHRLGLAFLCEGPLAVDATYAKIVAAGFAAKQEPWDAF